MNLNKWQLMGGLAKEKSLSPRRTEKKKVTKQKLFKIVFVGEQRGTEQALFCLSLHQKTSNKILFLNNSVGS